MAVLNAVSPLGPLTISEEEGHIVRLGWDDARDDAPTHLLREAARQLGAYFAGELTRFDLPLKPEGSDFGKRVWQAMSAIPYGETATYGALAQELASSARAVGRACGANPIPVIVPCHRVVARGGGRGGYSGRGGLRTKEFLLELESPG